MVTRVAPLWLIASVVLIALLALGLIHRLLLWALRRVDDGAGTVAGRRTLAVVAATIVLAFFSDRALSRRPEERLAPAPVFHTYAHQLALVLEARSGEGWREMQLGSCEAWTIIRLDR